MARDFIVGEHPDAIIDIIDATNIERNLYLTAQLLELERPMVIALNFMDEVEKHGDRIDVDRLSQELGVPVIPITCLLYTSDWRAIRAATCATRWNGPSASWPNEEGGRYERTVRTGGQRRFLSL